VQPFAFGAEITPSKIGAPEGVGGALTKNGTVFSVVTGCTSPQAYATLLDAMLKLLSTNAPALAVANKEDTSNRLGFVTLTSINREITHAQRNKNAAQETTVGDTTR